MNHSESIRPSRAAVRLCALVGLIACIGAQPISAQGLWTHQGIGQEVSVPQHLPDGSENTIGIRPLLRHGKALFEAPWTTQEGAGRPLTKGTGAPVSDPSRPLTFPHAFNRVSAMDANSCAGCHNAPFGVPGGGGDFVTGVFVLGQRFDFATFDDADPTPLRGVIQEDGTEATLQSIANYRATVGMFGSGYIELLAREITADLQAQRDVLQAGASVALESKSISYGTLSRDAAGNWDVSQVDGLAAPSLATSGPNDPPSLVIRPFHQAGNVVSVRQFTNNAFNHHHGIQTTERFGIDTDPDGDGFMNEMTRADVTAASMFQATMAVPGRVIPRIPAVEEAVALGEARFEDIGCNRCHIQELPLNSSIFSEPNPFNPAGNLQVGQAPTVSIDLNDRVNLPTPRLRERRGVTMVPAFTDLKLHDITSGPGDPNAEVLDQNQPAGSAGFFAGNGKFLTRKLWGFANEPPYFHHGQFTTIRQAVLAHSGDALAERQNFQNLPAAERDAVIEYLKTLRVLPPGTKARVVDEFGRPRAWPVPARGNGRGHGHGNGRGRGRGQGGGRPARD